MSTDRPQNLRFVALTAELFQLMPIAEHLRGAAALMASPEALAVATRDGLATALLDGGRVIGAGGVLPVWAGRGVCWFIPGLWMERRHYARALYRCRQQLQTFRDGGFVRLDCTVATERAEAIRWARRIGFVDEANLVRYGQNGQDHTMMRWEPNDA